jgi:hypothetical protein
VIETQIDGPHYHHYSEAEMAKVSKQLPEALGPDIVDQRGWTTQFIDTPPRLPASNSIHYDTEETVTKAREVVSDLKTRANGETKE